MMCKFCGTDLVTIPNMVPDSTGQDYGDRKTEIETVTYECKDCGSLFEIKQTWVHYPKSEKFISRRTV